MKAALIVVLCAMFGAAAPTAANANSALDQYVEDVPNTNGDNNQPDKDTVNNDQGNTDKGSNGNNGTESTSVDSDRARQLEAQGDDGKSLLALANSTGSGGNGPSDPKAGGTKAQNPSVDRQLVERHSPSAAKSLTAAAGASGINAPLFLFVVLLAVAMGATAWLRRGRGAQHS